MLCYGVSVSAFLDYFQIGETTCQRSVSRLAHTLVKCPTWIEVFLRRSTKSDARRNTELLNCVHKIPRLLGLTIVY